MHQGRVYACIIGDTANGGGGITVIRKEFFRRVEYLCFQILVAGTPPATSLVAQEYIVTV